MIQWFDNTLAHFINNTPAPLSVSALDHLQQKPNISQNKNGALGSLSLRNIRFEVTGDNTCGMRHYRYADAARTLAEPDQRSCVLRPRR